MSFDDTWASATVEDQPDRTQPPEPGLYTVAIQDAKAITSEAGEDWVIIELEGIDGAAPNTEWSVLQGFKSPQQAGFTKRVCRDLGVDIDAVGSLDELDTALKPIVGRYFTVQVKQNGEYRNTYFQGQVKHRRDAPRRAAGRRRQRHERQRRRHPVLAAEPGPVGTRPVTRVSDEEWQTWEARPARARAGRPRALKQRRELHVAVRHLLHREGRAQAPQTARRQ
jgi:hypothetical protein